MADLISPKDWARAQVQLWISLFRYYPLASIWTKLYQVETSHALLFSALCTPAAIAQSFHQTNPLDTMSDSNSDSDSDIDVEGLIAPIQQHDIRRIVAGQVVSDLASSVKELVDNALDADATGINSKNNIWWYFYER